MSPISLFKKLNKLDISIKIIILFIIILHAFFTVGKPIFPIVLGGLTVHSLGDVS